MIGMTAIIRMTTIAEAAPLLTLVLNSWLKNSLPSTLVLKSPLVMT